MTSHLLSFLIITLIASNDFCCCAKILSISPIPAKSHFICTNAIMRSLRDAGHEVTMITSFPQLAAQENYTKVIDTTIDTSHLVGGILYNEYSTTSNIEILKNWFPQDGQFCSKMIRSKGYQDLLNSTETFDIIFVEIHFLYKCTLPIAQKLKSPVIGMTTHKAWYLAEQTINNPYHPADVPFEFATSWKFNNFYERLLNMWNHVVMEYVKYRYLITALEKFHSDNVELLKPYSGFADIKPALIFYNGHHSVLPRPMNPNAVEIGGLQVPLSKPLPENILKFIEEAKKGVIVFTFGSTVKTSSLPADKVKMFLTVFAKIPQRVIWKFEEEIENLPSNVKLMKWLPQRDILEHPNVKAFISHCGIGGMYEAICTATPIVACPLMFDQPGNAAILENLGVAVQIDIHSLSEESFLSAIDRIINDTKYFDNMQKLSKVFKDRPMTPEQTVVYWTEYIIRHKGAPNLKTPSSQLNWFQYFLLDILCFSIIAFLCTVYISYRLVKLTFGLFKSIFKYYATGKNKLE